MAKKIFAALTALILFFAVIFSSMAIHASAYAQPDAAVESISIYEQSGVLEGEALQLHANIEASSTLFDSVEWSSSNPQAISCTKDGIIEGLVAGKSATITCKAKYGNTSDQITVYCVKKLSSQVKSGFEFPLAFIYSSPGYLISENYIKDLCFDASSLKGPFSQFILIFAKLGIRILPDTITFNQITVCGKSGSYAYIRYGENNSLDGFVKNSSLKNTGNAFLTLSSTDMNIWADGVAYESRKLTTKYKGEVEWIYDKDSDYFKFDKTTGQITGKVPGKKVTITAKADGETATCTIHLLYKWPQEWTGKTNRKTNIYYAKGNTYSKGTATLPEGTEFVVQGDCGTSNGWAYGYCEINGENCWGYIPISHISTKGTVSQYNSMNFRWPVDDVNINKISSPYGPRSSNNGGNHKGFDITTNNSGEIEGKPVVASYAGTIKRIYIDNEKETSHGNSIVITTDKVDPISGKNLTVIYMHLSRWDTNSSGNIIVDGKVLKEGDSVTMEQIIGFAGNTGYNTSGAHLHYEVNNQNVAIRSGDNNPFTQTINPIYFYRDKSIIQSTICEAYSNGNGFYWYGENN